MKTMTPCSALFEPDAIRVPPAADAADAFCVHTRVARDADEQAGNLSGWRQTYDQLTPGAFSGSISELRLPHLTVFCESTSHALRQTCQIPSDAYWFGIPLQHDGPGQIDGHPIADDALAVMPSRHEFELMTLSGYRILGVVVDEAELRSHACDVERIDLAERIANRRIWAAEPRRKAALGAMLRALLSAAHDAPPLLSEVSARHLRADILSMLFGLGDAPHADGPPQARSRSYHYWIVTQARDYILANRDRPVAVPELCRQFHISRRTLQYCFEETLGMTPMTYLRAIRLNGARRDLCSMQERPPGSIQTIAARWGFWHLSQFATDYRKLFGKRPSESLRGERGR
jgi:AraC family transcriptional regulator, ethanolamine operon transcriptional activator